MELDEIAKIVRQGESCSLEFKKSTARLKPACETACAFLNGNGGIILIGITDDGLIIGQDVADKTKREIGNELAKISPVANIAVEYIVTDKDNKQVIVLHVVTDALKKPYSYDSRAYLRHESDTVHMPREHYQQLVMNNASKGNAWEDQTQLNITLENLDIEEIISTVREGTRNGRIPEDFTTEDPWMALKHLGLIENNNITNAAIILFAQHPERWFPQNVLKLARFRGVDKSDFIDSKQVSGHAFKLLAEAMAFTNTYLPIASVFPKNALERIDTPLFPIKVLREAIANSICHRDYAYRGGSISLAIFDDRLEIWNYGLLPNGLSVDTLKQANQSVPRNVRIAKVLYYHKITETWGRGIKMIVKLCLESGHPEPSYAQVAGGTLLTLHSKQQIGNTITQLAVSPLTDKQTLIIDTLRAFEPLSTKELQEKMQDRLQAVIPERTVRRELNNLKKIGLVSVKGQTNNRKWYRL